MKAIEVKNLKKTFDNTQAVQGISFDITQGQIFSLLGPNGAGKTTTISILSTLLKPDSGSVTLMGYDLKQETSKAKACLGVVPQDIALYEDLTAAENLNFWGKMYGLRGNLLKKRIQVVLEMIGLDDRKNERVGKYSGGMKRRVNIGVALLHNPKILFMDEPTVGIDPQSRRHILDSIKLLNQQGMTVLYTTHYMEEAQELSDQIAIMDKGRIIAMGTQAELIKIVGQSDRLTIEIDKDHSQIMDLWQSVPGVQKISGVNGSLDLLAEDSNQVLPRLFEIAAVNNTRITAINIQEPNLEAVFLHLTGKALRD
ncbi:MAG: export ABC transporter ATP-binding protein [Anaerolineaceae bacterium]|nr:export ABC transporter ATP-binding protein [Anaerolineaceae bacterium]